MYDSQRTSGDSVSIWSQPEAGTPQVRDWPDAPLDVVVVGAGITGLSTAYHLLEAGRSVLVIDKGDVASGETSRSTAHVSNALDDHYFELERLHGAKGARLAAESHAAAIASIEAIARKEDIACEFTRVDGYLFGDQEVLHKECIAARRAGLEVALVDASPLPFASGRALRFGQQAQFEPVAYVRGLARAVMRRGGQIRTRVCVRQIDEGETVRIHVDGGGVLQARALVVATNTPIVDRFSMHTKQAAYRSYAIALEVPPGAIERALYWDTEDPYHYIRLSHGDGLLIVGGEDHKTGQSQDPEASWQRLEAWTRERFPMAGATRARWSGQVWEPNDALAFIGRNPGSGRNVFICTGDSGNGITHGALAGILLTDLIIGRSNPWARLYDPSRKPLALPAAREFVKENLNTGVQYADYVMPHEGSVLLRPGEGAVVRRGLQLVAAYVDERGERHECSAVCTHLGGPVHWNNAEKSWDCPCHGARFDPYGRVLTGPARSDLSPVERPHEDATEERAPLVPPPVEPREPAIDPPREPRPPLGDPPAANHAR